MTSPDTTLVPSPIRARLETEPFCFEFFQAVRLLGRFLSDREPPGAFHPPSTESARFSAHAAVTFPASEIQSLEWREGQVPRVTVNFMGLTGPLGVLPVYYTELVMERLRARDTALRDFLDLFNHRSVSLFFRAWEKHRFLIAYEREQPVAFVRMLLAILGLGTKGLEDRQAVPDESLLFYAGLLGQRPRSAAALELMLEDYFDVPVGVEQFVGAWCKLDPETQTRFQDSQGISQQLGGGAVVGDEVWDLQSRVRIRLGPMPLERYLDFLPTGSAHAPLRALTRFFSGDELDYEVQLILDRRDVPACVLGADGGQAPMLGWATWVKSVAMHRDPADTILRL